MGGPQFTLWLLLSSTLGAVGAGCFGCSDYFRSGIWEQDIPLPSGPQEVHHEMDDLRGSVSRLAPNSTSIFANVFSEDPVSRAEFEAFFTHMFAEKDWPEPTFADIDMNSGCS